MHYLIVGAMLYLFWLLLSGHYSPFLLGAGAVSILLVTWVLWRMDRVDGEPRSIPPSLGLVRYGTWLLGAVIKSNIEVVRLIWDPKLPIQPTWRRLDVQLRSTMLRTLYANSITLTPGTLTTDVEDDHFMVHSLTEEGMQELEDGRMERKIRRLHT